MDVASSILVAGGDTLLGAAIAAALRAGGYRQVTALDAATCTQAAAVEAAFAAARPSHVFVAAGRSAGIAGNQRDPVGLMTESLAAALVVLPCAHRHGVAKLLYLASSCCYPRDCPQPMAVEQLGGGPVEPTSAAYATAKLAGVTLCAAYRQQHGAAFVPVVPADAFGLEPHLDPADMHVVPALLWRLHEAKRRGDPVVQVWGSGQPRREVVGADDLAAGAIFIMQRYDGPGPINLGTGTDCSIAELAALVREVVGYEGELEFDPTRPDGAPRKLLDSRPLRELGWRPATPLREALAATYRALVQSLTRGTPVTEGAAGGR